MKSGKKWITPNHDLQDNEVDLHFLFNDKLLGRKHTGLTLLRLQRRRYCIKSSWSPSQPYVLSPKPIQSFHKPALLSYKIKNQSYKLSHRQSFCCLSLMFSAHFALKQVTNLAYGSPLIMPSASLGFLVT